jgi:EAL and modified HD-GYP domain-containing signal transduction protein
MSCLRLLEETQREEIDFEKLRDLIRQDVSFCYKLLRFTNSAMFNHPVEIRTVERALMALGENGIRRWVGFAALRGVAGDKPNELIMQSMLRAQFAERVARMAGVTELHNWFLMGLFSLLDTMLDQTIESALEQLKLSPQVEETLLRTAPPGERMACVYALISGYETGDWDEVSSLAKGLGISGADVGAAYLASIASMTEFAGLAA